MKKLFAMAVSLLAVAGCTVEEGDDGRRTLGVYGVFCSADEVMQEIHLRTMDVARLTEEYIGASEAERPAIWEQVPYYFHMTEVEQDHWQLVGRPLPEDKLCVWHIYTGGTSLYEEGSRWTVTFARYENGAEQEWTQMKATIESLGGRSWNYSMTPAATGLACWAELSVSQRRLEEEFGEHLCYVVSGTGRTQVRSSGGYFGKLRRVQVDYRADAAEYVFWNLRPRMTLGGGYELTLLGEGFPQPVEVSVGFLPGGTTVTVGGVSEYYGNYPCSVLRR